MNANSEKSSFNKCFSDAIVIVKNKKNEEKEMKYSNGKNFPSVHMYPALKIVIVEI